MSRSEANSGSKRQKDADVILTIAGVLSVIQSVIYAALFAAAITSHYCLFEVSDKPDSNNIIGIEIYYRYFKGDCDYTKYKAPIQTVLKVETLHYWFCVSLVLNVLWFIFAVGLLTNKHVKATLGIWAFITTFVLASDIGLTTVFTMDLVKIFDEPINVAAFLALFLASILPLMVASKGFVTLFINFALLLYSVCVLSKSEPKEVPRIEVSDENNGSNSDDRHSILNRPPIDAYNTENNSNAPPQPPPFNPELLHRVSMLSAAAVRQRSEGINRSFVHQSTGQNSQYPSAPEPHIPAPDYFSTEEHTHGRMVFPPKSALKSTRH